MDRLQKIVVILAAVIAVAVGFCIGRLWPQKPQICPLEPKVDTLIIRDTFTQIRPISVERKVVEYVPVPVTDTMRVHDTLVMYMEREQVVWQDSLSAVYASGILPRVDSVQHFTSQMVITKEFPVIQVKRTRWGVGIQAGYGIGKDGLSPYVGVGISYNIVSF